MVTGGRKTHQTQTLKTARVWASQPWLGKMSGGKACPRKMPRKHFTPETWSAQLYAIQLSTGPHWAVARDVRATGIQCPSECLQKSRSRLNSRNGEFTPICPRAPNDISLATHLLQWPQPNSHLLYTCTPSSQLIWFEME